MATPWYASCLRGNVRDVSDTQTWGPARDELVDAVLLLWLCLPLLDVDEDEPVPFNTLWPEEGGGGCRRSVARSIL